MKTSEEYNQKLKRKKITTKRIYKFVASLCFLLIIFLILDRVFASYVAALCPLTAKILSAILKLLGTECSQCHDYVEVAGRRLVIIRECTGINMLYVYLAAVFAYPAEIRKKLAGVGFGVAAIFLFNMLRLLIAFLVIMWRPEFFGFIHTYVWHGIGVILVLLMFIFWISWIVKGRF
jgi:archaeosortase B (VPXXXP-CTERM-specific)